MKSCLGLGILAAAAVGIAAAPSLATAQIQMPAPQPVDAAVEKPRVVVISDIGGDPDDQQSFVRFLLYSNQFDVEALVAVGRTPHPEAMQAQINAYAQVRPNLLLHAKGWPEPSALMSLVAAGQTTPSMVGTGENKSSDGSKLLVKAIERNDPRPLWITIWGGASTLAQALIDLRASHSPEETNRLISKIRVYSISDQDDAGPWIRREFPSLFYIVNPSNPGPDHYHYATSTGIAGDRFFRNGSEGADFSTVTNEWLDANIRSKGPLGKLYPNYIYIMEGDTPSFLGLIDNGLNAYRRPDWGGWGGRYNFIRPYAETHPIWTSGGTLNLTGMNSQDSVVGADGRTHVSDQATIWRWREAFQHDFAARINWTVSDYAHANHNPVAVVNGQTGSGVIEMAAEVGKPIVLDAGKSSDPDGQRLTYRWFHYPEAGSTGARPAVMKVDGANTAKATVTPTAACGPSPVLGRAPPPCPGGVAHIILAVTDTGTPKLTTYRRVILTVQSDAVAAPAR